jgi:uncharacterized protein YbaP (TraB family)
MKGQFASLIFCLTISVNSYAASVWKVSKNDRSLFIGGTVHLLGKEDYPLPDQYDRAYQASDILVFETDIESMHSSSVQRMFSQMTTFRDGTKLQDVLSKDTFAQLKTHLSSRNIPVGNIENFKAGMVTIMLSMIELQMMGLNEIGVDQYYSQRAQKDGKPITWLEAIEFQINLIATLGEGFDNELIQYTLDDIKNTPETMNDLLSYWRSGDMQKLEELSISDFEKNYPQIYTDLVSDRNLLWIPQIETMLESKEVEFVLVGAMHLAGPDSVLLHLSKNGYRVDKL